MTNRLYKLSLLITILVYLSRYVSPEYFFLSGFAALLIPVFMMFHIFYFFGTLLKKRKINWWAMGGLIISLPYILLTLSINQITEEQSKELVILSYNVQVFNVYKHLNTKFDSSKKIIEWVLDDTSDVKCFQEYHNQDESDIFNVTEQLTSKHGYNGYSSPFARNKFGHEFGLAIFTKHPILNRGKVKFDSLGENNHAIYVDIIHFDDTIRIYNTHLESMSINPNILFDTQNINLNYQDLFIRLKNGMVIRSSQIDKLMAHISTSPFKVILCGDLNETPYSYVYQSISASLNNAFDEKGNGFGFSYNGNIPFLRIDSQFASNELNVQEHHTCHDAKYSDHFPIKCRYNYQ